MYCGNIDVIAYFPLVHQGIGIVPGLGWLERHNKISWLLKQFPAAVIVTIVAESPGKAPLYVSGDTSFAYSNGSTVPQFRMESMNLLRHFRPRIRIYLGHPQRQMVQTPPTPYQPQGITNNLMTSIGTPPVRTYVNKTFDVASTEEIVDATGTALPLHQFVCGHEASLSLVPDVVVGGQAYKPVPVALAAFDYGSFEPAFIHAFIAAINPTDAELASRDQIRSVMRFGTTFRHDVVLGIPPISVRFPSDANSSLIRSTVQGAKPKPGKRKRKPPKGNSRNEDVPDDAISADHVQGE
jgi:hypothetical protein